MKPKLVEAYVEPIDLTSLKGAGHEDKMHFLEGAWTRFRLRTGWQANRATLKALRKKEAYSLVLDQEDSLVRFGVLNAAAVEAHRSFPPSDRPGALPRPAEPLEHNIAKVREAGKLPVLLLYWANPRDGEADDDLLWLTYESMPGAVAA